MGCPNSIHFVHSTTTKRYSSRNWSPGYKLVLSPSRALLHIGRRGSLHPYLSSARLIASLHVIFMHQMSSCIISCQFFRGLPLLRFLPDSSPWPVQPVFWL